MRFSSFALFVLLGGFVGTALACVNGPHLDNKKYLIKDSIIITSIESSKVEHDTISVLDSILIQDYIWDNSSTFICIRHAEAESGNNDPILNTMGMERAKLLRDYMAAIPLSSIYSTDLNRTRLTATPTAEEQDLVLKFYDSSKLADFADEMIEKHPRETCLIVGHSDSTPEVINHLIRKDVFEHLDSGDYGKLFIVSILSEDEAKITHLCYGD